ncbi:hypothetical protein CRYUN_Cryun18bG0009300 [Craigia yunnanensis]
MKGNNNSSSNQPSSSSSSCCSTAVPDPPPQPIPSSTESTYKDVINKYKNYNYNNSNVTRVVGVGDLELKRQRRVVKYKSYAVESQLKSSLMNRFCWMKNRVTAMDERFMFYFLGIVPGPFLFIFNVRFVLILKNPGEIEM